MNFYVFLVFDYNVFCKRDLSVNELYMYHFSSFEHSLLLKPTLHWCLKKEKIIVHMYLVCINVVFKVQKIEEHITIKVVQ